MNGKRFKAEALWQVMEDHLLMDVRTPAEYLYGHIPGAVNLPLFDDEERREVGTLYKQVSPEQAFLRGLDLAGARLRSYVERAGQLASDRRIALHCWRGGQRSGSLAWLLGFAGFEVLTLEGGYKVYRRYILQAMADKKLKIIVLGGPTGSRKTEVLHELAAMGEQVIDLERLANHKGSAFGALGEPPQPSYEQFSNDLFEQVRRVDNDRRVWVENESKAIGLVRVPDPFWDQMTTGVLINMDRPFALRIEHLVTTYGKFSGEALRTAFMRIKKRLGSDRLNRALEALDRGDLASAAATALAYYDKAYRRSVGHMVFPKTIDFSTECAADRDVAAQLIQLADANRS